MIKFVYDYGVSPICFGNFITKLDRYTDTHMCFLSLILMSQATSRLRIKAITKCGPFTLYLYYSWTKYASFLMMCVYKQTKWGLSSKLQVSFRIDRGLKVQPVHQGLWAKCNCMTLEVLPTFFELKPFFFQLGTVLTFQRVTKVKRALAIGRYAHLTPQYRPTSRYMDRDEWMHKWLVNCMHTSHLQYRTARRCVSAMVRAKVNSIIKNRS